MNGPGDQLLPRAAFTLDQYIRVMTGNFFDYVENTGHLTGFSDDVVKAEQNILPLLQFFHFRFQSPGFQRQKRMHDCVIISRTCIFYEDIQDVDLIRCIQIPYPGQIQRPPELVPDSHRNGDFRMMVFKYWEKTVFFRGGMFHYNDIRLNSARYDTLFNFFVPYLHLLDGHLFSIIYKIPFLIVIDKIEDYFRRAGNIQCA
ncbi:MAG: hypothetical protein A4E74_02202 [Syntrophus sp. PtaB.Bin075]|nr:MAG: hypothetical protein A4E74_02202 [Syntrophus sp. PtaB.Bin075]